ncbi:MAG TPA: hypothetical protein VFS75_02330 [Candidatus Paceibacterota bacterium]|nr:hypothetical protein [Candidatus Paceibacterota bacterium]
MAHTTFELTISKVDGPLYAGPAESVTLPGAAGELTVYAKHEPLIALLKKGTITVRGGEGPRTIDIERGLLEVSGTSVTVLV